jgi:hypothetical protein
LGEGKIGKIGKIGKTIFSFPLFFYRPEVQPLFFSCPEVHPLFFFGAYHAALMYGEAESLSFSFLPPDQAKAVCRLYACVALATGVALPTIYDILDPTVPIFPTVRDGTSATTITAMPTTQDTHTQVHKEPTTVCTNPSNNPSLQEGVEAVEPELLPVGRRGLRIFLQHVDLHKG